MLCGVKWFCGEFGKYADYGTDGDLEETADSSYFMYCSSVALSPPISGMTIYEERGGAGDVQGFSFAVARVNGGLGFG